MNKKLKDSLVFLIPIGLVLVLGLFLYFGQNSDNLSIDQAADKAVNYLNNNVLPAGITASLIDISEEGEIYKVRLEVDGIEYQSYISKDGRYLFPDGYDLDAEIESQQQASQDVPKQEKPDVKLFVMSYCPYGLQAQKMYLPVYDLLSDKVDMGIYFVNYVMHEKIEIDENLTQYCIQKEEREKYSDYLSCFIKDGDAQNCLLEAKINEANLTNCIENTDEQFSIYNQYQDRNSWLSGTYPKFDVHDFLNQKYGIGGSPTMVINDVMIVSRQSDCPSEKECLVVFDFERSPESFKELICQAFASQPEECLQVLSDVAYVPGFGLESGTSDNQGCSQ
jgi:hypothetical protein